MEPSQSCFLSLLFNNTATTITTLCVFTCMCVPVFLSIFVKESTVIMWRLKVWAVWRTSHSLGGSPRSRRHLTGLAAASRRTWWVLISEMWQRACVLRSRMEPTAPVQIPPLHWMSQRLGHQKAVWVCGWTLLTWATLWFWISKGPLTAMIKIPVSQWLDSRNAFQSTIQSDTSQRESGALHGHRRRRLLQHLCPRWTRRQEHQQGTREVRLDTSSRWQARKYRYWGQEGNGFSGHQACSVTVLRTRADGPWSFLCRFPDLPQVVCAFTRSSSDTVFMSCLELCFQESQEPLKPSVVICTDGPSLSREPRSLGPAWNSRMSSEN